MKFTSLLSTASWPLAAGALGDLRFAVQIVVGVGVDEIGRAADRGRERRAIAVGIVGRAEHHVGHAGGAGAAPAAVVIDAGLLAQAVVGVRVAGEIVLGREQLAVRGRRCT